MARIRTLKPEFWTDEKVVKLSSYARLLFIGLLNFADDDGYLWDEPITIKLRILPLDNVDCSALLNQLVEAGMLLRYAADDDKVALHVLHFAEHQKVSHPAPSKILPRLRGVLKSSPDLFGALAPEGKGKEWKEGMEVPKPHIDENPEIPDWRSALEGRDK